MPYGAIRDYSNGAYSGGGFSGDGIRPVHD